MVVNIETAINNMYDLMRRATRYSMYGSRIGTDGTADCSGAIYDSLRKGGATNAGWVLNTDSMHAWLVQNGFKLVAQNQSWAMKRGDVIIFGLRGSSGGAAGHIVIAIDGTNVIHCNYSANGVSVNNENTLPYSMGFYVYRMESGSGPAVVPPKPANKNGIAIDNISYDQAKHMVPLIQSRYAWTLATEQVKAIKQADGRYTLVITCDNKYKYEHSINRLKQELKTHYPGYMQQNIAIVDGDKPTIKIEARNMPVAAFEGKKEGFDIYMRKFLCDVLLYDQTFGQPNSYGTWDVRVLGEGFNSRDAATVLAEVKAEGKKKGIPETHIKGFKY
ncbi:peptidoglycan amidohydrolase family protein [Enterococcus pallens]|uniref:NlpC/P60 domain-containing protein n=1 Tax=Enterococcus pallens ATCC BAA-351 TaxID=1158607 RepID=R2PQ69_9ENTE|nr:peptidoglycan amidohydrolase family protein [Enterococcus pallens]EOH86682.1 hypothetical protein UAU_05127 [Enterococcus pallens ATCC BAA-351]EOU18478.1 hypothetical protein I588_03472 [Enterococcus pallens ATCC BAA-351]OJG81212.1 hypothetical protein RV10_GL003340 [Enterococcus pallens]